MDPDKHKNFRKLRAFLEAHRPPAIAFSGGTDSAFLAWAARYILGNGMRAYTFDTPYMNHSEIREARDFCERYDIPHEVIPLPMPEPLLRNPKNRCYLCKLTLFSHLKKKAGMDGLCCVMDGSILDDQDEHRPGKQAIRELGILSPLTEAGFTKEEIRKLSKEAGLPTWNKPSNACLLTRIPYSRKVSEELLRRIEKAEELLHEKGFSVVRVRTHGTLARIELSPGEMERILKKELREEIIREMKDLGYTFVTLDIAGFRSGSYDQQ
jgi:uncharacterized protein